MNVLSREKPVRGDNHVSQTGRPQNKFGSSFN